MVVEEVFPLPFYWSRSRKQVRRAGQEDVAVSGGPYDRYYDLCDEDLRKRLSEERDRAKGMDEKTFKMTLALTLGLTVLSSTAALLVQGVAFPKLRAAVGTLAGLAIFYSLSGGFLALGALRTLPSFGYGTDFAIRARNNRVLLVRSLVAQEVMNIVRHLRNESAYQCLRNGFLCLFAAVILYAASVAAHALWPGPEPPKGDDELFCKWDPNRNFGRDSTALRPAGPLTSG